MQLDYHWDKTGIVYKRGSREVCRAEYQGSGCYVLEVSDDTLTFAGNLATTLNGQSFSQLRSLEYAALALACEGEFDIRG